jgi:carbamoylphosphate synthase large subunit
MSKKPRVYFIDKPDWEKWIRMVATDFELFFGSCETCHPADYDLVIPLTISATNYLSRHYPHYNGVKFLVSESHVLANSNHKGRFAVALMKLGLSDHCLNLPDGYSSYPYVLKKAVSEFGVDAYVVENAQQERELLAKVNQADYIRQRWVAGDIEYVSHLLFDGKKALFHHSIEYQMPQGFYIKGRPTQLQSMQPVDHERFLGLFESILAGLNFKGLCCFDYKLEKGEVKLFELNARYGGTLSNVVDKMILILFNYLQHNAVAQNDAFTTACA